ncbi:hypothetical protein Sste5344_000332 [Sporothrix stenoceras]
MQAHDDLAALLARNLTFGPIPVEIPAPAPAPVEEPKIVYSISQHYHHSAHTIKPQEPVAVEQPSQQELQMQEQQQQQRQTTEQILIQNGIDPTALTPVQFTLFQMSAPDRRDYLLQLWRICPPTRTAADYNAVAAGAAWDTMEAEMEKEIASSTLRAQQMQQDQSFRPSEPAVAPAAAAATTTSQSADGRWLQESSHGYMEPYMASGYEELARREYMSSNSPPPPSANNDDAASIPRSKYAYDSANPFVNHGVQLRFTHATDPVYANRLTSSEPSVPAPSRASWPQPHHASMEMENQYGALMAMRDSCEMEM